MNDEGIFDISSNLPLNEEFLSIALFDEPIRDIAMELLFVEVTDTTDEEVLTDIEFSWIVTQVSEKQITIQITFDDPLLISNDSGFDYHRVKVKILKESFFFSTKGEEYILDEESKIVEARIP